MEQYEPIHVRQYSIPAGTKRQINDEATLLQRRGNATALFQR